MAFKVCSQILSHGIQADATWNRSSDTGTLSVQHHPLHQRASKKPPPHPSTRWTMRAARKLSRKGAGQRAERAGLALKSSHAFVGPTLLSPGDWPGTGERDPPSSVGYTVGPLWVWATPIELGSGGFHAQVVDPLSSLSRLISHLSSFL